MSSLPADQKGMYGGHRSLTAREVLAYLSTRFTLVRIVNAWLRAKRRALLKTICAVVVLGVVVAGGLSQTLQIGDQIASIVGGTVALVALPKTRRLLGWSPIGSDTSGQAAANDTMISYLGEAAPHNFVNREQYIRGFDSLLAKHFAACQDGQIPCQALIVAIGGMAGVGKTALALHWGHRVKDQFPDGQFYVDLRGYSGDGGPILPREVLTRWLKQLRPNAVLPEAEDALSAMFKDTLVTKRVLLIIDNGSGEEQVRPLLPSVGASVAIVTSREVLDGVTTGEIGAAERLAVLRPTDSHRMLTTIIGPAAIDDPDSVASLAEYCAHLPLALKVTARSIATKSLRGYPLRDLVAAFNVEKHELSRLRTRAGNSDGDVRMAFSYSYRALGPNARRAFRLLGLHLAAGSTIDPYIMGSLLGRPAAEAASVLEDLEHEGLVTLVVDETERHPLPELAYMAYRYRVHDLLRLYAAELIGRQRHRRERRAALERLARAYYGCVNHAFDKQNKNNQMVDAEYVEAWRTDPAAVASVDGAGAPTQWFDRERPNLLNAVRAAGVARPRPAYAAKLASSLFYFLEIGGHTTDWNAVEQIGAEAAEASGDKHDQARSLRNRGRIALVRALDTQDRLRADGDSGSIDPTACDEAILLLEQSLALYRREYKRRGLRRDRAGEVTVLRELGDAYRLKVDPGAPDPDLIASAITTYSEAAAIYAALESENGLNSLWVALGAAYCLEDPEDRNGRAEELFTRSHRYGMTMDNGRAQHGRLAAYSLIRLGGIRSRQQRQEDAIRCYREAIAVLRAHVGHDHVTRARALALLGHSLVVKAVGSHEAEACLREALEVFASRGSAHRDEAAVASGWLTDRAGSDR